MLGQCFSLCFATEEEGVVKSQLFCGTDAACGSEKAKYITQFPSGRQQGWPASQNPFLGLSPRHCYASAVAPSWLVFLKLLFPELLRIALIKVPVSPAEKTINSFKN